VKTIVGAIAEEKWLVIVGALIEVVPELVMNGAEVVGIDLDAHFEPQVLYLIDIPGAGVADHIPVARLHEQ